MNQKAMRFVSALFLIDVLFSWYIGRYSMIETIISGIKLAACWYIIYTLLERTIGRFRWKTIRAIFVIILTVTFIMGMYIHNYFLGNLVIIDLKLQEYVVNLIAFLYLEYMVINN